MDDKKIIDDYNNKSEGEEFAVEMAEGTKRDEEVALKSQAMPRTMAMAASPAVQEEFSNVKEYPESPFSYYETNQVSIQLNSGAVQYQVTDFVLPGRDGFDISITRRYDSGCSNLDDIKPKYENGKIKTKSTDNSHNTKTYGLGYGWSFALPSIERVMYLKDNGPGAKPVERFDYIFHHEDGRSLNISRSSNRFANYSLNDVSITFKQGSIEHRYVTNMKKNYHIVVEYKNGNKDYFKEVNDKTTNRNGEKPLDFKLVARQDRFENVILYDLVDDGGMTIVDSWGRELKLEKNGDWLIWKLPGGEAGEKYELSYQLDRTNYLKLISVTDMVGGVTNYDYYDWKKYWGDMRYAFLEDKSDPTCTEVCRYMLLMSITYPDKASTEFEYGESYTLQNDIGGRKSYFALALKKDMFGSDTYNETKYSYEFGTAHDWFDYEGEVETRWNTHIQYAYVEKHQDVKETYQFNKQGLLLEKKIRHKTSTVLVSKYTYKNKLMTSATEQVFNKADQSKMLEKKMSWEYDGAANMTWESIKYPEDSGCNQEIKREYGKYSIVIKMMRTKGSDEIQEITNLSSVKEERVAESRQLYEKGVLKEKTVYDYGDPYNPYCITGEKRYSLGGTNDFIQTVYTYDSRKYTHKFVTKEQKGINGGAIKDVDGNACGVIKETYNYDSWGRMISKTDSRNQVSKYEYDKLGRVVKEEQPSISGQPVINRTYYNNTGNYITKTDANNQKTRIQYTPFGQVAEVSLVTSDQLSDGMIILKKFRYNTWGELEEANTYNGNGTTTACIKKTENYTYDSFGRVLTREIPQIGYVEQYQYEDVFVDPANGKKYNREQKKVCGDDLVPELVTVVYKDQKGQIRKEYLAGSQMTAYDYDNVGNVISKTDALGKVKYYEYDYADRLVKTIQKDGNQQRTVHVEYDGLGNKRFSWDEAEEKTEFQYDPAGRLMQIKAPFDGRDQFVKYFYDAAGNVTWEKKSQDSGWQETQYVYDVRNRLTDTCQYLSQNNWIRNRTQYDAMDRIVWTRTGDTPSGDGRQITKYTYDRFGNIVTMTDARGCKESYQYDKVGRLQEKTDRNGNRTVYQFDALERLKKETVQSKSADGMIISEREYSYNKTGQASWEASRENVDGKQTTFLETKYFYDPKGRLIRQGDPGNVVKEYSYDTYGNRQSFRLTRNGQAAPDVNLYYVYDDLHRLKQVRRDGAAGVIMAEYEYDIKGNRKSLRYPQTGMETTYTYNKANRVTFLENKKQGVVISAWKYDYDIGGNMVSKTNKTSATPVTISYRYDRLGRLTEEDYPGWKRSLYEYDACSNRIKVMVEGKTKEELVSVTSYEYSLNNRLEKEVRKQGKVTETWQYRYDDNGNETFRIWGKTSPTPDYPGSVKFTGSWQKEVPTVYEWRHYNGFHQLIRVNQDDKEIIYQYRGDGLRHSSEVRNLTESQSKTKVCYWDGADIVAEQMDGGSIKSYLRGINLIAREADGMIYYYVLNEHGDVAQMWGQSVTCKASYEYDAFGNEKNPDKEDENPFRYCGEYLDLETNTYYLRARSYRVSTGRFTSEDPIRDGLNWYTYANNNPLMFVDPLGLASVILKDYAKAMGATIKDYTENGKSYVTVTYDKTSQDYILNNGSIDDSVLNNTFGWNNSWVPNGKTEAVYTGVHEVAVGNYHSSALVFIAPESTFYDDENIDFQNYDGGHVKYASLGAGSTKGKLTSGVNREKDINLGIKVQMISMGVNDVDTINSLFENEKHYGTNYKNVNYALFPDANRFADPHGYNSNSFAHGLLISAGITPITPSYKVPGWIKPLPKSYFGR